MKLAILILATAFSASSMALTLKEAEKQKKVTGYYCVTTSSGMRVIEDSSMQLYATSDADALAKYLNLLSANPTRDQPAHLSTQADGRYLTIVHTAVNDESFKVGDISCVAN